MNLLMGFTGQFLLMSVIWGINGYAQAMIWPPIIRIFAEMLEKERKMKYCVDIVSSQVAGTLASYLIAAGVMWLFGWKAVFAAAAVCLAAMAAAWTVGFGKIERGSGQEIERDEDKGERTAEPGGGDGVRTAEPGGDDGVRTAGPGGDGNVRTAGPGAGSGESFSCVLLHCGLLAVLFPVVIHGMLKDGVTTWVPTYITETFLTSPSFSILVTAVLPVLNLTGAYAARFVYEKCKGHEIRAAAVFFRQQRRRSAGCGLERASRSYLRCSCSR